MVQSPDTRSRDILATVLKKCCTSRTAYRADSVCETCSIDTELWLPDERAMLPVRLRGGGEDFLQEKSA